MRALSEHVATISTKKYAGRSSPRNGVAMAEPLHSRTHVASYQCGSEPLVSIIIPYYNQPEFVIEAVLSAKRQTFSNVEIIVVDDGSLIPAESVLSDIGRITIVRTENRGVSKARNTGFAMSSGDYLIFLDQDDRLSPNAITAHLKALREKPEAGLSFGSTRTIDAAGMEIRPPHICRPRKNYFHALLESNPVGPSPGAVMIPREVFIASGPFNASFSSMGEDYDLYLRIARRHPLIQHATCTLEYRKHNECGSSDQERMFIGTMAVLDQLHDVLTESERRKLPLARSRWRHATRQRHTLLYRLWGLYFSFRAMLDVPVRHWLRSMK